VLLVKAIFIAKRGKIEILLRLILIAVFSGFLFFFDFL